MKPKTILSSAILATLPLTANATGNHIGPNGEFDDDYENVEMATDMPYYEKMTIGNDDKQHIASTAYVKGAYNDTMAAINKSYEDLANRKQEELYTFYEDGTKKNGIMSYVYDKDMFIESYDTIIRDVNSTSGSDIMLATAAAVAGLVNLQRATVYTTWDNDNATKQVAFVTASAQSGQ